MTIDATPMSMTDLLTLFADGQPADSIPPAAVRTAIVSLLGGWGRISSTGGPVSLPMAENDVWYPIDVSTELGPAARLFDMPGNNRLRCFCVIEALLAARASINLAAPNGHIIDVALRQNEAILEPSMVRLRFGPGGGVESAVLLADFLQIEGDEVSAVARRVEGGSNPTIHRVYISAQTRYLNGEDD
jgi:hypothetical protein